MVSLFNKRAPETVPTEKHTEKPWTVPTTVEGLATEISALRALIELSEYADQRREAESKLRCCEDALALKTESRFMQPMTQAVLSPCNHATYLELLKKAEAVPVPEAADWVQEMIERNGGTIEKFHISIFHIVHGAIIDYSEKKEKKPRAPRKIKGIWEYPGPIPGPGMTAKRLPDGRYTHAVLKDVKSEVNDQDPLQWTGNCEALKGWCRTMGLPAETVDEQWAQLMQSQKLETLPRPTVPHHGFNQFATLNNLRLLQARIALYAKQTLGQEQKKEMALFETKKEEQPAPAATATAEPPKKATFTFNKPAAAAPAAQEAPKPAAAPKPGYVIPEEEWLAIRQELGIKDGFVIDSKEKADWAMRKMQSVALDLEYIIVRYADEKSRLERAYKALQERFKERLEEFADNNKPADGKKSINLLWGSIGWQNQAASASLDPADKDELALQGWIHTLSQEQKDKYGCKPLPRYTRDLKAIKADVLESKADKPGLLFKAAQENVFYVRPSLDSVKDDIKKRNKGAE